MPLSVVVGLALHVLSTLTWAGTAVVLAIKGGAGAERLYRPQMIAALIAFLSGGYLWHLLHAGGFGPREQILTVGVLAAIIAAGVQGAICGAALRKLRKGLWTETQARPRIALAQRIAAGLLVLALVSMVAVRSI